MKYWVKFAETMTFILAFIQVTNSAPVAEIANAESLAEIQESNTISSLWNAIDSEKDNIDIVKNLGIFEHFSFNETQMPVSDEKLPSIEDNIGNDYMTEQETDREEETESPYDNRDTDDRYIKRTIGRSRTKRSMGRFWSKPSHHSGWFNSPNTRTRFGSGSGFHRASMTGSQGTGNSWVHRIPDFFPNATPRYANPVNSMPKTPAIFPGPATRKPAIFPGPATRKPDIFPGPGTEKPDIFPVTTTPSPPKFTLPSGSSIGIDSGLTIGYTFSDGNPLTLEPDAETLTPLL